VENSCPWKGSTMKFSDAIGKLHCGAGFNTGQKQKTLSVPGRLWSMYILAVEWNLTKGLLTVYCVEMKIIHQKLLNLENRRQTYSTNVTCINKYKYIRK